MRFYGLFLFLWIIFEFKNDEISPLLFIPWNRHCRKGCFDVGVSSTRRRSNEPPCATATNTTDLHKYFVIHRALFTRSLNNGYRNGDSSISPRPRRRLCFDRLREFRFKNITFWPNDREDRIKSDTASIIVIISSL